MRTIRFFFYLLLLPSSILALLPSSFYQDLKRNAPEVLLINAKSVIIFPKTTDERIEVVVMAKVMDVHHSVSNTKVGDLIRINYYTTDKLKEWEGPLLMQLLKVKVRYKAFLRKNKKCCAYLPVAGGESFILE